MFINLRQKSLDRKAWYIFNVSLLRVFMSIVDIHSFAAQILLCLCQLCKLSTRLDWPMIPRIPTSCSDLELSLQRLGVWPLVGKLRSACCPVQPNWGGGGQRGTVETNKQTNRMSPRIWMKDVKQQSFCFFDQEVKTETFVHVSILICWLSSFAYGSSQAEIKSTFFFFFQNTLLVSLFLG